MKFIAILFVLTLTPVLAVADACDDVSSTEPNENDVFTEVDAEKCASDGGRVEAVGLLEKLTCVKPYADAGKKCNGSHECIGLCEAFANTTPGSNPVTGTCQRDLTEAYGCYSEVLANTAREIICVD